MKQIILTELQKEMLGRIIVNQIKRNSEIANEFISEKMYEEVRETNIKLNELLTILSK